MDFRTRSTVHSTKGIVSTSQPLATQVGIDILNKGGNCADAAVAVAAALNVTEPCSTGIGGDMFCLFYNAVDKSVKGLNGSGRSPKSLSLNKINDKGIHGTHIPSSDLNSVTVPGTVAGWIDTIELFGSKNLTLKQILDPAICLARYGYPVSEKTSQSWHSNENLLKTASKNGNEMLINNTAPLCGEIIKLPTLADTFDEIAINGKDGFYDGRVAKEIVQLIKEGNGEMTLDDLKSHTSTVIEPINYVYKDEYVVHECPPNGQGLTTLMALGILENAEKLGKFSKPLIELDHNGTEYLHALIEALRLAFADTKYFVTDPQFFDIEISKLLSKEYLESRAKLINMNHCSNVKHGNPTLTCDTTYFTVGDKRGNAISFIQSNYDGFGTGAIPKGCGFTLQNRGSNFTLEEGHPNVLEGNKRPYHTIIPGMCTLKNTGELFLSFSVMGGFNQPQGQLQTFLNVLRGYSVQQALDLPRFCIGSMPARQPTPNISKKTDIDDDEKDESEINTEVNVENGISEEVKISLQNLGHDIRSASNEICGRGQIIKKTIFNDDRFVFSAGSDYRADGCAIPQL